MHRRLLDAREVGYYPENLPIEEARDIAWQQSERWVGGPPPRWRQHVQVPDQGVVLARRDERRHGEGRDCPRRRDQEAGSRRGGSLESCYFAFGSDDLYAVVDAPSHEAMAAIAGTVTSAGVLSSYQTVVLLPRNKSTRPRCQASWDGVRGVSRALLTASTKALMTAPMRIRSRII